MCPPLHPITATSEPQPQENNPILALIPPDPLTQGAYQLAKSLLPPSILHHSIRVSLFAARLAQRENSPWATDPSKPPLLAVACLLHDIGCATQFDGPQRFEVEGADAAANYLRQHQHQEQHPVTESDIHEVWTAIALHSSPGIAERISDCARLVRQAVLVDFGKVVGEEESGDDALFKRGVEGEFPRLAVEKDLGDVVVEQALRRPGKAPAASWPGVLVRAKKEFPEWEGVNKGF
ncbi:hypothetical protein FE257_002095 [Aspergillus nanangensis]|uniref:HD/PDEase domain-containing protein n=1 Tax=Aspergillus nanangensis TaxID=2582783 RepID=A0AAD4GY72_ASPNN|nr:hypothetical protein FE257_002095 [Aspergillus nanangensis]